jgi:L-alanine-DL-glutamate epimerase-like enolase superfamily enzyme
MIQFAAATPNIGVHMEFPHRGGEKCRSWYSPHFKVRDGKVAVPEGPGMGVEFDPAFLKNAERVTL